VDREPEDPEAIARALRLISVAVRSGVADEINARRTFFVSRSQTFTPIGGVTTSQTFLLPPLAAQLVRLRGVTCSYSPWLSGAPANLSKFTVTVGGGPGNPVQFDLPLFGGIVSINLEELVSPTDTISATVAGTPAGNTQQLTLHAWGEQEPVLGTAT
jgi:hypothetical protein